MPENNDYNVQVATDYSFAYNILTQVIPYLEIPDLVACSQVCTIWRSVIKQAHIWSRYQLKSCGMHLNKIPKGVEKFVKNIEFNEVFEHESSDFFKVMDGAENVVQLSLFNVQSELIQPLKCSWNSLQELNFKEKNASALGPFLDVFQFAENLTTLNIETSCSILLADLSYLKQLKHLYVDADYCKGFFISKHKYLRNLENFGVGYSNYKHNASIKSLYNNQLSTLLLSSLKNLCGLKLSNLENDFLILATVSRHPKIQTLYLTLTCAWNHYSFFLSMCTNIKKLIVTFNWPQKRFSSICEIAAHNSLLLETMKKLKNTLTNFTWIFETRYMGESEVEIAVQNNKWRHSYTAIWENIEDFDQNLMSYKYIQKNFANFAFKELSLEQLKDVVSNGLGSVKVDVRTDKYRIKCQFCNQKSKENVSMFLLRLLRKDRRRAQWIQNRFCYLPLNRVR